MEKQPENYNPMGTVGRYIKLVVVCATIAYSAGCPTRGGCIQPDELILPTGGTVSQSSLDNKLYQP